MSTSESVVTVVPDHYGFDAAVAEAIARNPKHPTHDSLYDMVLARLGEAETAAHVRQGILVEVLTGRVVYEQAQSLALETLAGVQADYPCSVDGMITLLHGRV